LILFPFPTAANHVECAHRAVHDLSVDCDIFARRGERISSYRISALLYGQIDEPHADGVTTRFFCNRTEPRAV